jgi:hypothetical protein|tara:strand:+ start:24 stop:218 length:195 start_codon:yes stop_codon:yes gene_type:complete
MTMMVVIVAQRFHVKIKVWLHALMVRVLPLKLIVLNQVRDVLHVTLIGQHMVLNAVIRHGMSLE